MNIMETGQRTRDGLGQGGKVLVLPHHSPPPLEHQQELRLPNVSADSPPGQHSSVVLTFHVVLGH